MAGGGELLFYGCTKANVVGRSNKPHDTDKYPNQYSPVRLAPLAGVRIAFVAAGPAACHSLAVAADGRLFAWGRNEASQLGLGDTMDRNAPCEVALPGGARAASGACGKHHTACVTDAGELYTWGADNYGQLGHGTGGATKKVPEPRVSTPAKAALANVSAVSCGAEFTVMLAGGSVYACGMPQHGQLGNGTEGDYNTSAASIKIAFEPHPRPAPVHGPIASVKVRAITCGVHHSLAADESGGLWSWGDGGYGRLGHNVQKDELEPKRIAFFSERNAIPTDTPAIIAAGATMSLACGVQGQLFMWGKIKVTGDNWMYPKPMYDLSGWQLRSAACGGVTTSIASEFKVVNWGTALYGELGFGEAKKSSANPKIVDALDGYTTLQTACGAGHTLALVDTSNPEDVKLLEKEFKVYTAPDDEVEEPPAKRGAPKALKGPKKGAVKKPKAAKKK